MQKKSDMPRCEICQYEQWFRAHDHEDRLHHSEHAEVALTVSADDLKYCTQEIKRHVPSLLAVDFGVLFWLAENRDGGVYALSNGMVALWTGERVEVHKHR